MMMVGRKCDCQCADTLPSIVTKKLYMRTSTSSHVIRYGARENMTGEADKKKEEERKGRDENTEKKQGIK